MILEDTLYIVRERHSYPPREARVAARNPFSAIRAALGDPFADPEYVRRGEYRARGRLYAVEPFDVEDVPACESRTLPPDAADEIQRLSDEVQRLTGALAEAKAQVQRLTGEVADLYVRNDRQYRRLQAVRAALEME